MIMLTDTSFVSLTLQGQQQKLEQDVKDHVDYQDCHQGACDWLNLMRDRQAGCADVQGDKHMIEGKLDRLQVREGQEEEEVIQIYHTHYSLHQTNCLSAISVISFWIKPYCLRFEGPVYQKEPSTPIQKYFHFFSKVCFVKKFVW